MEMRLKQAVLQVYFSGGGGALPANINTTFIQSDQDFNNDVLKTFFIHRSQSVFVIECSFMDTHLMFL